MPLKNRDRPSIGIECRYYLTFKKLPCRKTVLMSEFSLISRKIDKFKKENTYQNNLFK